MVGGSVTLTVGDGGGGGSGGGSLQISVEEGLDSCDLAPRILEPESAGLTVLWGRHCHDYVRDLLQESLDDGTGRAHHVGPLLWRYCQLSLNQLPIVQPGLEARHGAGNLPNSSPHRDGVRHYVQWLLLCEKEGRLGGRDKCQSHHV